METKKETVLAQGIYASELGPKTPDWVLAKFGIKVDELEWLSNQFKAAKAEGKEYVNFDVLRSKKTGKPYVALDTYVKKEREPEPEPEDDIPF